MLVLMVGWLHAGTCALHRQEHHQRPAVADRDQSAAAGHRLRSGLQGAHSPIPCWRWARLLAHFSHVGSAYAFYGRTAAECVLHPASKLQLNTCGRHPMGTAMAETLVISCSIRQQVVGDDLPYGLPFAKTIFLLEDVDAACDVVKVIESPSETC